jgi:hypothetical protein
MCHCTGTLRSLAFNTDPPAIPTPMALILPLPPGPHFDFIYFDAGIQPLRGQHGHWHLTPTSKPAFTVDTFADSAARHVFKSFYTAASLKLILHI